MTTFEELYRRHVQAVFRFARSIVGQHDLAEDLTSEAFLALYKHLDSIDAAQLPAWLFTVVRNAARDRWRRAAVEQRYLSQLEEPVASTEPPLERWILDAPDLKPIHRTCIMLRYAHGMTRAEIAAELGLSDNQVKSCLQYALTLLRKTYGGSQTT